MSSLPNLIIGGAPKCGTSSLYRWLVDHPQVEGARVKETFFFMDEGHSLEDETAGFGAVGLGGYEAHFPRASKVLIEGTTHYLYQETALREIPRLGSEPAVVFVVRDPVARLKSSFAYTKHTLGRMRPWLSFDEYVDALLRGDDDRIRRHFFDASDARVLLSDLEHGRFVRHLRRWRAALPPERLVILEFESLLSDPAAELDRLLEGRGIAPGFYEGYEFGSSNETYATRRPRLHRVARALARRVPLPTRARESLRRAYWRVQERQRPPEEDSPSEETLARLAEAYAECDAELSAEFGVDVSSWASARHAD